jgi:hypothetical protein
MTDDSAWKNDPNDASSSSSDEKLSPQDLSPDDDFTGDTNLTTPVEIFRSKVSSDAVFAARQLHAKGLKVMIETRRNPNRVGYMRFIFVEKDREAEAIETVRQLLLRRQHLKSLPKPGENEIDIPLHGFDYPSDIF